MKKFKQFKEELSQDSIYALKQTKYDQSKIDGKKKHYLSNKITKKLNRLT